MAGLAAGSALGEDPVQLTFNDGLITEADVVAGEFDGQSFTLGNLLELTIRESATLGSLGELGNRSDGADSTFFDLHGTSVILEDGGNLGSPFDGTAIDRINLTLKTGGTTENFIGLRNSSLTVEGGDLGNAFTAFDGTSVLFESGTAGGVFACRDGSTVVFNGGIIGPGLNVSEGANVTVNGGMFGFNAQVRLDAEMTVNGGVFDSVFTVRDRGSLNFHGGSLGNDFLADENSQIEITGGTIGGDAIFEQGACVRMTGGSLGRGFRNSTAASGAAGEFRLVGNSFAIDGVPIEPQNLGDSVTMDLSQFRGVLTGTFADGSPILYVSGFEGPSVPAVSNRDSFGVMTFEFSDVAQTQVRKFNSSTDIVPGSLAPGQSAFIEAGTSAPRHMTAATGNYVEVQEGGTLPAGFRSNGSTLVIDGGTVGGNAIFMGESRIELRDGVIGTPGNAEVAIDVIENSVFKMSGGVLMGQVNFYDSNVMITGGTHEGGGRVVVEEDSTLVIDVNGGPRSFDVRVFSGGSATVKRGSVSRLDFRGDSSIPQMRPKLDMEGGDVFSAFTNSALVHMTGGIVRNAGFYGTSEVVIEGGAFDIDVGGFDLEDESVLEIIGSAFEIDGIAITDLELGSSMVITDREVTLSGLLARGGEFSWFVSSIDQRKRLFVEETATLKITLVPAPAASWLTLTGIIATRRKR